VSGIVLSWKETSIPRIVQAVRQLLEGRSNAGGTVTLRNGHTTTVVSAPNCSPSCNVFLTPKTAAAAALTPPYVQAADTLLGSFTITHTDPGGTDATFGYEARG
jgi:hypothetical protein